MCLKLVVRALKERIAYEIKTLLPLLFSSGLSKGLYLLAKGVFHPYIIGACIWTVNFILFKFGVRLRVLDSPLNVKKMKNPKHI